MKNWVHNNAKWMGIVLVLLIGAIHLIMAPDELPDAPQLAVMFVGCAVGSFIAAVGIYRGEFLWGWSLTALLAAGSLVGYLLSRTIGLPLSGVEDWGPPMAYLSLIVEALFIFEYVLERPRIQSGGLARG